MKHTEWLRLFAEGELICAALRHEGYQCIKQFRRLSWKIRKGAKEYLLTWLPRPVSEWSVLPPDTSPERNELMGAISHLFSRGGGR